MTTTWRFEYLGEEYGPVAFRELVGMVREGVISEGDRVRASWMIDWQRAEDVVGLFRMARLSPDELERFYSPHLEADKGVTLDPEERKEWWDRFEGARAAVFEGADSSGKTSTEVPVVNAGANYDEAVAGNEGLVDEASVELDEFGEPAGLGGDAPVSGLADAIAAAVETTDGRTDECDRGGWSRVGQSLRWCVRVLGSVDQWGRPAYRVAFSVAAGWLTWSGLTSWNESEQLRFPSRDRSAAPTYSLPFLGSCSESEFSLAVVNAVGIASIAAFAAASWLLSKVDD